MKVKAGHLTDRQKLFCQHYVGEARHVAARAARLAGYAPGCSNVTGCQLLQLPKIAATVRGLEAVAALEMEVTRQGVIAQLVAAAEMAKLTQEPSSIVSAMRQVALMCGYYRQETLKVKPSVEGLEVLDRMNRLSDAELVRIVADGRPDIS